MLRGISAFLVVKLECGWSPAVT